MDTGEDTSRGPEGGPSGGTGSCPRPLPSRPPRRGCARPGRPPRSRAARGMRCPGRRAGMAPGALGFAFWRPEGRAAPPGGCRPERDKGGRASGSFPAGGGPRGAGGQRCVAPSRGAAQPRQAGPRRPPQLLGGQRRARRGRFARELPAPAANFSGLWESGVEGLSKSELLFAAQCPPLYLFIYFPPTKRREKSRSIFFY